MITMKKWLIIILGILLVSIPVQASKADLDVFPPQTSACRLGVASYEVKVKNIGPVEDTYDITANSGCKCITITPQEVNLESGEEKSVYVWYNPDTSVEPGNYEFTVKATSQTSGKQYTKNAKVKVLGCRDLDLSVRHGEVNACRNESVEFQFKVENTGREKENVKLTSEYGTLSKREFALEPSDNY